MKKQNEILTVDYRLGDKEIIFFVEGEARFKMPTPAFLAMIDTTRAAERIQEKKEADIYFEIAYLGPRDLAKIHRLLKKGLLREQVSALTGIPDAHIRQLMSRGADAGWGGNGDYQAERETLKVEGHDYVKLARPKDTRFLPDRQQGEDRFDFVEVWPVKRMLDRGASLRGIAGELKLDPEDFESWYELNKGLVDAVGSTLPPAPVEV